MSDTTPLFHRVLLPLASVSDAELTVESVLEHLGTDVEELVVVHVIEKGGGSIDKAPLERRQRDAADIFEVVESLIAETDIAIETEILYGQSVTETIFDAASTHGTTAICFSPREANRLINLLTGDVAYSLITESKLPVVVLPKE